MPYKDFEKKVLGSNKFCSLNLNSNKIIRYNSKAKKTKGKLINEAISYGWKPRLIGNG